MTLNNPMPIFQREAINGHDLAHHMCTYCGVSDMTFEEIASKDHYPSSWIDAIETAIGGLICERCAGIIPPCSCCGTPLLGDFRSNFARDPICEDCYND